MFVARWQIDARFGQKQQVIDMMRSWDSEIGVKARSEEMDTKILTGSVGAREATVELNHTVASLANLEEFFAKIGRIDAHAKWGNDLEPHVVSGSSFWNIYRVV